jgi:TetR/AcrR family transcriptional regulator, repressor for divergent bdcA
MTTNKLRGRGRPRNFDPTEAIASARVLFHARGYDAVSVSDITKLLGINPPSFYAAFGSKVSLFKRVLDHWAGAGAIPMESILRPDRPVAMSLAILLEEAARHYAADPSAAGCLVLENTRCDDKEARDAALAFNLAAEDAIRQYVALRHPENADCVADFVSMTMSGLSAKARNGHGLAQLLASARLAAIALKDVLPH